MSTMLEEQAREALLHLEVPDPPTELAFGHVRMHEVLGPDHEPLLVAFGLVPLPRWLEAVNTYHAQAPEDAGLELVPWDPEDSDKVVAALNRLSYSRVAVVLHNDEGETPFTIQWGTEGLTPITVWRLGG